MKSGMHIHTYLIYVILTHTNNCNLITWLYYIHWGILYVLSILWQPRLPRDMGFEPNRTCSRQLLSCQQQNIY